MQAQGQEQAKPPGELRVIPEKGWQVSPQDELGWPGERGAVTQRAWDTQMPCTEGPELQAHLAPNGVVGGEAQGRGQVTERAPVVGGCQCVAEEAE